MKLIAAILYHVLRLCIRNRSPDQVIYRYSGGEYLRRWWMFGSVWNDKKQEYVPRRIAGRTVFLHQFVQSDDDRAKHDHPWRWWSLLLRNNYYEHIEGIEPYPVVLLRFEGEFRTGVATHTHRIELQRDTSGNEVEVWTLFGMGAWERDWGFHCKDGWKWWRDYDRDGGCAAGEADDTNFSLEC